MINFKIHENRIALSLLAMLFAPNSSYCRNIENPPTAVCSRRIPAILNNIEYNNYETIILKSSGNVNKDVYRLREFNVDYSPMKNPHMKPFIWIGAYLYDKKFDGVHAPNCSTLPKIRAQF